MTGRRTEIFRAPPRRTSRGPPAASAACAPTAGRCTRARHPLPAARPARRTDRSRHGHRRRHRDVCQHQAGLSNYGKYIVIRHVIEGLEIYSLYAHLSEIQSGLAAGKTVKAGEVIATMGRTSNTSETIAKDRAHVPFRIERVRERQFFRLVPKNLSRPAQRPRHLERAEPQRPGRARNPARPTQSRQEIQPAEFFRGQTELCRVLVRATNFPYLKRYPPLVLKNPIAEKEGVAGYEIALNYNAVPFALMPRAASEIKGSGRISTALRQRSGGKAQSLPPLVVRREQPLAIDRHRHPRTGDADLLNG